MNAPLQGLTERIRQELVEIDQVFKRLSEAWQRARRTGDDFYALLVQMSKEVAGIRPAVISPQTVKCLDEYRGFPHVVRNVYTYHFDEAKLEKLVLGAGDAFAQVRAEILAFADFLDVQG